MAAATRTESMTATTRVEVAGKLAALAGLTPDVPVGQVLARLELLVADRTAAPTGTSTTPACSSRSRSSAPT